MSERKFILQSDPKIMRIILLFLTVLSSALGLAQSASSYAVRLDAKYFDSPHQIKLSWLPDANATSYNVYRKDPDAMSFGIAIETLAGTDTTYIDLDIEEGKQYEYAVRKYTNSYAGFGYVVASADAPIAQVRGDVLLLVEANIAGALSDEILDLEADMMNDGWEVQRMEVDADTTVSYVKELILNADQNADDLQMVYLLGHIPVPYSGNLAPDAHSNHIGAWPADVYYAELNGTWTDFQVNNTSASDSRNHNISGDGKFDQSTLPSPVELMISRVDFANLDAFSQNEITLTKRYLDRVHAYKNGEWDLTRRALVDDNFGGFNGEAFAANGWRNFAPLVGKNNIYSLDYRSTLDSSDFLFSYGCGGGSFTSANGIGNTTQLATDSLRTGFTMLFGSYFGDWDRSDNFLRAALAQGSTMSISWAGRPHWHYQSMGAGYPIGHAAKRTQNNSGLFVTSYGAQFIHIAQLGDPTLRMEYPAPATNVTADTVDTFHVQLTWTASIDANVIGYNVYQKEGESPWFLRNQEPLNATSYIDSCIIYKGSYTYMVRAVEYINGFSGGLYNESLGSKASIEILSSKSADGIGDFVQTGANPVTGLFVASYLSWITNIEWEVDGEILTGNGVPYEPTGLNGDPFSFSYVLSNACSLLDAEKTITLEVDAADAIEKIKVYPNPIRSETVITLSGLHQPTRVELTFADGRLISSWEAVESTLQAPRLSPGTYLLRLENSDQKFVKPLIVSE